MNKIQSDQTPTLPGYKVSRLHWTVSENSDTMQVVIRKVMGMSFEDRVVIIKMQY